MFTNVLSIHFAITFAIR